MSCSMTFTTKGPVHLVNTQISLGCPHEEILGPYSYPLSAQRRFVRWMPRLICVFTGRTDHFAGFVMLRLKWFQWIPVRREVQLAALQKEINYVLLYLILLFWNIWHVKIFLKWPNIYVKYGLGWQWPMLDNTFTVFEWANLWGVKIITENVYCKVQNGYKIIFF